MHAHNVADSEVLHTLVIWTNVVSKPTRRITRYISVYTIYSELKTYLLQTGPDRGPSGP